MKQTSLSAAPGQMEAPPRAPHGKRERRTASQLMRRVRRTGGWLAGTGATTVGIVKDVAVVPFDEAAAERFAEVAADLAKGGTPIGAFDTLVAAQDLSLGRTVVTNNTRHFSRVAGLKVENWL